MSKIAITPNASGTGTINIVAPNTNTDRTLTIPDVTGNVVTTGDSGTVTTGMLNSTLDLSGKTVDFGLANNDLPNGSILKVWNASNSNEISNSVQNSYDAIFSDISVTTTGTNSRLIYLVFLAGVTFANSNARMSLKVGYNGVSSEIARDAGYTLGDVRFLQSHAWVSPVIASAGTSVTANMYYAPVSNGDGITINDPYSGAGLSQLIIMEAKGL